MSKKFAVLTGMLTIAASYFVAKIVARREYEKTTEAVVNAMAAKAVDECVAKEIKEKIDERLDETALNKEVEKAVEEVKTEANKELSDIKNRYLNYGSDIKRMVKDAITDNLQTSISDVLLGGIARSVTRPI